MRRVLIAGFGFLGVELGRRMRADGWDVTGVRASDSAEADRLPVVACDISDALAVRENLGSLESFGTVVHCASSGHGGSERYRAVYLEGVRNLLGLLRPERLVFTSSTSVYGQTDGAWVTERSAAEPERETGRILRETEEVVLAAGGVVARLAGLYGPGRSVLLRKFFEGTAFIEGEGDRIVNQIHRDDAATALALLADPNAPSGLYNVADDHPLTQLECYRFLAECFGRELPPRGPVNRNRKRGWTRKRVSNAKLRALGWVPRYSSFTDAVWELAAAMD